MSKIKIEKVLKAHEPKSGVSQKNGKAYVIYQYECKGAIDSAPSDLFTVKTMSEATANLLQAGGEFDAEPSVFKGETSYMVKGAFASGQSSGGWKNKYQPRVYLSAKQFHDMAKWIKGIADELYPQNSVEAFDKLFGCASVLLDLSKYSQPKAQSSVENKTPIRQATQSDVQTTTGDPHAELTDSLGDSDVPF